MIEFYKVTATVVDGNGLEKILPIFVFSIVDLFGSDDSLYTWVLKNEVLDFHVVINEGFKLLVIYYTTAISIYLLVCVLNVFRYSAFNWRGESG